MFVNESKEEKTISVATAFGATAGHWLLHTHFARTGAGWPGGMRSGGNAYMPRHFLTAALRADRLLAGPDEKLGIFVALRTCILVKRHII